MMSSDIYAKPDFSKKVRYNRKQQEDTSDWEESEVKIYNDAYESVEYATCAQSPEQAPQTETCLKVQKGVCKCEKWCLLALCTVLSAVFIVLSSCYMVVNISNLQKDVKEQNNKYEVINKTLLDEIKQLKNKIEGKLCPEFWMRFRSSCYYKSIEQKTWSESRKFCQDKGADLLVINSKEEQEFVSKLNPNKDSWIGLYGLWSSQEQKSEWKWVDGSSLTETFRHEEFSEDPNYYDYAVSLRTEGKWTKLYKPYNRINWICEK